MNWGWGRLLGLGIPACAGMTEGAELGAVEVSARPGAELGLSFVEQLQVARRIAEQPQQSTAHPH